MGCDDGNSPPACVQVDPSADRKLWLMAGPSAASVGSTPSKVMSTAKTGTKMPPTPFEFDHLFDTTSKQLHIFKGSVQPSHGAASCVDARSSSSNSLACST